MQQTRRNILDILKVRREATVDEIVEELRISHGKTITAVTVRHHLTRLQEDEMIAEPVLRHRDTPGRPQHVYSLTQTAMAQFPNNYQRLASTLLAGIQSHLPPAGVNVILEDVADRMALEAHILADLPLEERLDMVVEFLNTRGYEARWDKAEDKQAYILHTSNCPYHHLTKDNPALCDMDMRLVATLLNVVPRRYAHLMAGESDCAYLIPSK
jgi:predicted ArsR family transcriptional regulator